MQARSSEFQPARQGSPVLDMSPGIEPGVFRALPDVPDEQALCGIARRGPAVLLVHRKRHHIGNGIITQAPEVHRLAVLKGLGPIYCRFFWGWQRAALHETYSGGSVDQCGFIKKRRPDRRVLYHVIEPAEFI